MFSNRRIIGITTYVEPCRQTNVKRDDLNRKMHILAYCDTNRESKIKNIKSKFVLGIKRFNTQCYRTQNNNNAYSFMKTAGSCKMLQADFKSIQFRRLALSAYFNFSLKNSMVRLHASFAAASL
jgi:hypothetical protein